RTWARARCRRCARSSSSSGGQERCPGPRRWSAPSIPRSSAPAARWSATPTTRRRRTTRRVAEAEAEMAAEKTEGTLLLVDDSAIDTRVLASLFSREGYSVITAASGVGPVAPLVRFTPDVVITDIFMPGVDGYDLCRHIRAEPAWRWLPILGLTQAAELEAKLRGFEAGVDDFVSKDTPAPEL